MRSEHTLKCMDWSAAGEEVTAAAAWITRLVCWLCLSSCETVRIETAGAGVQDNGPAAQTQKMWTEILLQSILRKLHLFLQILWLWGQFADLCLVQLFLFHACFGKLQIAIYTSNWWNERRFTRQTSDKWQISPIPHHRIKTKEEKTFFIWIMKIGTWSQRKLSSRRTTKCRPAGIPLSSPQLVRDDAVISEPKVRFPLLAFYAPCSIVYNTKNVGSPDLHNWTYVMSTYIN
jgi:hypothetical protein